MNVLDWLLDSDASIRWQVLRDLVPAPAEMVAAERSRVATEGLARPVRRMSLGNAARSREAPTFGPRTLSKADDSPLRSNPSTRWVG
jgi:hypothetical protein